MNLKNSIHCFQRYAVIYSSIFLNSVLALLVYGARTHGNAPICSGEPAGGSLTADQWMLLVTIFGPVTVSLSGMSSGCNHLCVK